MPLVPEDHELPSVDFASIGPLVGDRFPDLILPNQHGTDVDLHEVRGGRRAVIVVHRSAEW